MAGSDPVRFVTDRESIISGTAHEHALFRAYEDPVKVNELITFLRTRDPRGDVVFVFEDRPNLKGEDPSAYVRKLADTYAADRPITWVLGAKPDAAVQRAAARVHDVEHVERTLPPRNVYASNRASVLRAEQQWSRGEWHTFGPFEIHDIEVEGRPRRIATPQSVRLSALEEAMEDRGSLEFYFGKGPFGIESTISAQLLHEPRTNRRTGEGYTPRQIRTVREPHLMHRDGYRFRTVHLNAAHDTIEPYLHKTS